MKLKFCNRSGHLAHYCPLANCTTFYRSLNLVHWQVYSANVANKVTVSVNEEVYTTYIDAVNYKRSAFLCFLPTVLYRQSGPYDTLKSYTTGKRNYMIEKSSSSPSNSPL